MAIFALTGVGPAVAADRCNGADGKWSFGGLALDATTAQLTALTKDAPDCPPKAAAYCDVKGSGGVSYAIGFDYDKSPRLWWKSRRVTAADVLPFGITLNDTSTQAAAKLRAAGLQPAKGMTAAPEPVSISLFCMSDARQPYLFDFMLDPQGHIVGLKQSPVVSRPYIDDAQIIVAPP